MKRNSVILVQTGRSKAAVHICWRMRVKTHAIGSALPLAVSVDADIDATAAEDLRRELLQSLTRQGRRLAVQPSGAELSGYRDLVREFLNEEVGRIYSQQAQAMRTSTDRRGTFAAIKQIDALLAEITADIRDGQPACQDKLDTIRDLLADLYM